MQRRGEEGEEGRSALRSWQQASQLLFRDAMTSAGKRRGCSQAVPVAYGWSWNPRPQAFRHLPGLARRKGAPS